MKPPRILIIAGSDSGGGAGIQADIKTVTMLGGFAMTAITAVTAQNTLGVDRIHMVPPDIVVAQALAVIDDIGVDAVKIGMLGDIATIRAVESVVEDKKRLKGVPIVLDPVMVAKGGTALLTDDAVAALWSLFGSVTCITPNVPELGVLVGAGIYNEAQAIAAGQVLDAATQRGIVVKGGHLPGEDVIDWVFDGKVCHRFVSSRIDSRDTHGTGCTLASAIAVGLARKQSLVEAVDHARQFVRAAMLAAPGFGAGHGPMGHQAVTSALP